MTGKLVVITALLPIVLLLVAAIKWSNVNTLQKIGTGLLGTASVSALSTLVWSLINGKLQTLQTYFELAGMHFRFDALSTTLFFMVSTIGFIVFRFSKNYLHGDANQMRFTKRLLLTIGLVQVLIISGSLFTLFVSWVATSFSLHYLIAFNSERKAAQEVVRQKFIVARLSDISLLIAFILLYSAFGTGNLEQIFNALDTIPNQQLSAKVEWAVAFLALAAAIKSVQVPFHGWILNVMEAPTPVSALLHAGLLNAGPFLIIRFAHLMDATTYGSFFLLIVGGISALYGTLVFPSQPAVKTSLAYSSIGHMGFSLMVCGMGLYPAALLHLVAHSFYKAHSFLASGSAVDYYRIRQLQNSAPLKTNLAQVALGFVITILLYTILAEMGHDSASTSFPSLILGGVIITGVASYLAKTTTMEHGFVTVLKSLGFSGVILVSFFTLENAMSALIQKQIPTISTPSAATQTIAVTLLALFVVTVFTPLVDPQNGKKSNSKWEIYKRNGFYLHVFFDRFITTVYPKVTK